MNLPSIKEERRFHSPTVAPQALAWHGKQLWMSSRDLGTLYQVDPATSQIANEADPPGAVWAGVATNGAVYLTVGKGTNDDRYIYRYDVQNGFIRLFACPDLT